MRDFRECIYSYFKTSEGEDYEPNRKDDCPGASHHRSFVASGRSGFGCEPRGSRCPGISPHVLIFLALALFVASEWRSRKAAERKDGTDRRSLALFIRRGSTKRSTCYESRISLSEVAMPAIRALRALRDIFDVANSKLERHFRFQRVDRYHQLAADNVGAVQIGFNVDTLLVPGGGRNRALSERSAATTIPQIRLVPPSESSVPWTAPEPRARGESILKTRKKRQVLWLLLGYSIVAYLAFAAFVPRLHHPKIMPKNGCGSCCYSNCLKQKRSLTPADAPSRPRRSD